SGPVKYLQQVPSCLRPHDLSARLDRATETLLSFVELSSHPRVRRALPGEEKHHLRSRAHLRDRRLLELAPQLRDITAHDGHAICKVRPPRPRCVADVSEPFTRRLEIIGVAPRQRFERARAFGREGKNFWLR